MDDDIDSEGSSRGSRAVEEVMETPFTRRHSGHMARLFNVSAELTDAGESIVLNADFPEVSGEDLRVNATVNTIVVDISAGGELQDGGCGVFHSSFVTPEPIEPDSIEISFVDGRLMVTARKKAFL